MSFIWSEYLDIAKELQATAIAGSPLEEAKLRAAISRAYYALFCEARRYIRLNYPGTTIPKDGTAHSAVRQMFELSPDPNWRFIGITLNRLRLNRTKADYDDVINGLIALTNITLQSSEQALQKLKAI